MSNIKLIIQTIRAPFLILSFSCIFLGFSSAYFLIDDINYLNAFLALIGGLFAHISVNAFNEYFDFKSGLDFITKKTPFSGGSGSLPSNPSNSIYTLIIASFSLIFCSIIGIYFLFKVNIKILPIGIFGLLIVFLYSVYFIKNSLFSLVTPGLGFGTFMVMGTSVVLTGKYFISSFILSMVPFFLVNDLLLLNQFPDVEADKTVGRKNFPILIGKKRSSIIYIAFLQLAFLSIIIGVILNYIPKACLFVFLIYPLALYNSIYVFKNSEDTEKLFVCLKNNVLLNIVSPIILGICLILSKKI